MTTMRRSRNLATFTYEKYKWYFLAFLCVFNVMTMTTFLYLRSSPFTTLQNFVYCKATEGINGNEMAPNIIHDVCSFVEHLNIDTSIQRECYFKHSVEEHHWLIGYLLIAWCRITNHCEPGDKFNKDNLHCSTININRFLIDDENKRINNQEISDFFEQSSKKNQDKYTILINTWRRNECLIKSVEHYLECNDVAQIRIIWSDPSNDIPQYLYQIQEKLPDDRLVFDLYGDNKLTNRFKYNSEWQTDAIFQTDDDIMFSCDLISNTFKLWQLIPDYMIGFAPREPAHEYHPKYLNISNIDRNHKFYSWEQAYRDNCEYSLLFETLGGFMHQKYYKMYGLNDINGLQNGWKEIKDLVNGNITAEDISMSLLYSFKTGYPPITVIVPESEKYVEHFLECSSEKSEIMHTKSDQKRTNIYLKILHVLGYQHDDDDDTHLKLSQLISSNLWVDVMPISDQKCLAQ